MDELMPEFEKEFLKLKKDLGFKASLDELDSLFYLKDNINKEGYISTQLSRAISSRISEVLMGWVNYIHNLIMPNASSLVSMIESQAFNEIEKQEMFLLFNKMMVHLSSNSINSITKDKKEEAAYIDNSLSLAKEVTPQFVSIAKKIKSQWKERMDSPDEKFQGSGII